MSDRSRLSVNISTALREGLELACDVSGRSLTAEVEARLRDSLNGPKDANGLLLLRLDEGIMAHLQAYAEVSLWGRDVERVGGELIRDRLIALMGDGFWGPEICRHLPERYWKAQPRFRQLFESMSSDPIPTP